MVLHVVQSGDVGGVQRHIRDLTVGLPELTAGVAAGTEGWLTKAVRASGGRIALLPHLARSIRPDLALMAGAELARTAEALDARIIHAHGAVALAAALRGKGRRPLIYTPHGFQWRDPEQSPPVRAASLLLHRMARRHVEALVAVSAQDERDALHLGYPRDRVRRIPNGVPAVVQDDSSRQWNTIGVATRIVRGKGLATLLRVLPELPTARLIVVGAGPLEGALRTESSRLAVADRVTWWGWQESLERFYRTIAVYASLSCKEGMPYAVLDALAYGVPVVASAIPAHRELLATGGGSLVVSQDRAALKSALCFWLADPKRYQRLGVRVPSQRAMLEAHGHLYAQFGTMVSPVQETARLSE